MTGPLFPVKDTKEKTINFTIRLAPGRSFGIDTFVSRSRTLFLEDLAKSRLESLQIVSSGIAHDFRNGSVWPPSWELI